MITILEWQDIGNDTPFPNANVMAVNKHGQVAIGWLMRTRNGVECRHYNVLLLSEVIAFAPVNYGSIVRPVAFVCNGHINEDLKNIMGTLDENIDSYLYPFKPLLQHGRKPDIRT